LLLKYYLDLSEWMIGRTNARVLPDPVGADTHTSFGLNSQLLVKKKPNNSLFIGLPPKD